MNFIESLNLLGVEAKQIPCVILNGAPTTSTEGAVGVLCMDVSSTGYDLYKCVSVENGAYTWKKLPTKLTDLEVDNGVGYLDAGTILEEGGDLNG